MRLMRKTLVAAVVASALNAPVAHADGPVTYTMEPLFGTTVTQIQFGGSMCPCVKIPYNPTDLPSDNQAAADTLDRAFTSGLIKPGDTVMGFSLGVQEISQFLGQHADHVPAGVHFLFAGDTFDRNQELVDQGVGVPWDIANDVTMVVNEYDAMSDKPKSNICSASDYSVSYSNSVQGSQRLHYYALADVFNPANVETKRGNITAILIPTQHLPNNDWMRYGFNDSSIDKIDAKQRDAINRCYDRPGSNADQRVLAAAEQVPQPNPAWKQTAEPVAVIPGPPVAAATQPPWWPFH